MKSHPSSLQGFAAFLVVNGLNRIEERPSILIIFFIILLLASTYSPIFNTFYYLSVILGAWVMVAFYTAFIKPFLGKSLLNVFGNSGPLYSPHPTSRHLTIKTPLSTRPHLWKLWTEQRIKEKIPPTKRPFVESKRVQKLMDEILYYVQRDFIKNWYPVHISQDPVFLNVIEDNLRLITKSLCERMNSIDQKKFIVEKAGPILLAHFQEYRKAERLWKGYRLQRNMTGSEEIDYELARCYMAGNLHPAVSAKSISSTATLHMETAHLRKYMESILSIIGPPNEVQSRVVLVFLREVLACCILQPVFDMLADPDYWNQTIEVLTEKVSEDKTLLTKIRDAIDKQNSGILDAAAVDGASAPLKSAAESITSPSFQQFVRQIKECDNLMEAFRLKDTIEAELQRKRNELAESHSAEDASMATDLMIYIENLEIALHKIEKQIKWMSGREKRAATDVVLPFDMVLNDTLFISYFAEFLEKESRRSLIHLWVTIESLKKSSLDDGSHMALNESTMKLNHVSDVCLSQLDALEIYETYLGSNNSDVIVLTRETRATVDALISKIKRMSGTEPIESKSDHVLLSDSDAAIFITIQEEISHTMEKEDYPRFLKSPFHIRYIQDKEHNHDVLRIQHLDDLHLVKKSDFDLSGNPAASLAGKDVQKNSKSLPHVVAPPPASTSTLLTPESLSQPVVQERTSFDADLSGADTDWDIEDVSHRKKGKWVIDAFKRKKSPSRPSSSAQQPRSSSSAQQTAPSTSSKSPIRKLFGSLRPDHDASTLDHEGDLSTSAGDLVRSRRLSRELDPISSSGDEDPGRHKESSGLSFKFLRKSKDKAKEASTLQKSHSGLHRSQPELRGSFVRLKDEEATSETNVSSNVSLYKKKKSNSKNQLNTLAPKEAVQFQSIQDISASRTLSIPDEAIPPTLHLSMDSLRVPEPNHSIWDLSDEGSDSIRKDRLAQDHRPTQLSIVTSEKMDRDNKKRDEKVSPQSIPSPGLAEDGKPVLDGLADETEDILGRCIPPTHKILEIKEQIEKLKKERKETNEQLKALEKAGLGMSKEKQRTLQLIVSGLTVELEALTAEKRQRELDVLKDLISDATSITIPDFEINQDGKEYAAYVIRVQQESSHSEHYEWTIMRRYSEFFDLHQMLKVRFGANVMNQYDLPSKVPFMKMKKDLIVSRRIALERYLENLAKNSDICKSREFLHFITTDDIYQLLEDHVLPANPDDNDVGKKKNFVKNILHNVDESMDVFLQKLKQTNQGMSSIALGMINPNNVWGNLKATTLGRKVAGTSGFSLGNKEPVDSGPLQLSSDMILAEDRDVEVSATDVIVDIFQEVFQLKERNNWLRRGAVLLIIQQIFGGTVDRKVTEQLKWLSSRENMIYYLERLKDSLWPKGKWWSQPDESLDPQQQQAPVNPTRTPEVKLRSKMRAKHNIMQLVPEVLGGVVGRQNARKGAERLFLVFQNRRLNQHLLYKLGDELLMALVPEIANSLKT